MSVRRPATTKEQIDADIQLSGRNPIAWPNRVQAATHQEM
jgi:hypothetical protein